MKAVIQRVKDAWVDIDGNRVAQIDAGLAVLLGVAAGDTDKEAQLLADKTVNLRIFEDEAEKMNLSVIDTGGSVIVVSQFTLMANWRKGRRPGFDGAAPSEEAEKLYMKYVEYLRAYSVNVQTGQFAAHMVYGITNDGPVTIIMDTRH